MSPASRNACSPARHAWFGLASLLAILPLGAIAAPSEDVPGEPVNARLDAVVAAPATLPPSRLRMEVHVGRRLLAQGLPERAAERFRAVVAAEPEHAGARYLLSRALLAAGSIAEGRDAAAEAVALLEKLPADRQEVYSPASFYMNLGLAEAAAAQLEPAQSALAKAVALAPDDSLIRLEYGSLLLRRGRDAEAADQLRRAIALGAAGPAGRRSLGNALLRLSDLAGAQRAFEDALKLAPDDADAHYGLASVFRALGETQRQEAELATFETLRAASEAKSAQEGALDALVRDAVTRMADGKCEEAEPLFRRALESPLVISGGRHRARILTDLAKCRDGSGAREEAEALYRDALGADAGLFTASFDLGTLLARVGRLEEAVPHLVTAVALSPFDHAAHLNLGLAWALLGRVNDAQAEVEKAPILQPDDLAIRQLLVDLHWAVGHRERARRLAEVGGVKVPDDASAPMPSLGIDSATSATGAVGPPAPAGPPTPPRAKDAAGIGWRE
jgi:tetratricopeptide (TPR) repeat protein